ncbi:MAG TPA: CBS domain-containing protein, partial [Gammaproteobacteria bacterium]|nr:CBS domain-containing protein [Gammaproteobacteria bacterium]
MMTENSEVIDTSLQQVLFERYPAEAIRQLEQLEPEEIARILSAHSPKIAGKIWDRFSPELGARVIDELPDNYTNDLFSRLDPNKAASFFRVLDAGKREKLLDHLEPYIANDLKRAIEYQPDTAGALMDGKVMYFRSDMTVGEALNVLRRRPKRTYRKLYTVDDQNRLIGMVEIEEIALADHATLLSELERSSPAVVSVTANREEMVEIFEKYRVTDLPVVDFDRRLLGVVRHHVLVNAALEENSADLQTMVGASRDERALSTIGFAVRKRQPWLQINLLTAFMAASVVGIFEGTIAQFTALAVLLPVVAGQSGNTGAQALAVTMRGLALKEVYPRMWPRVLFKGFSSGFWNGMAVAIMCGIGVYIWS